MDRSGHPSHGTVVRYETESDDEVDVKSEADHEVFGPRFGRMFDNLEPAAHTREFLRKLGEPGGPMDESEADREVGESNLPAGNPFFGQYIDHDITLDTRSELDSQADPRHLRNFRTPRLDLDSLYGSGREVDNYLYHRSDSENPGRDAKLLEGVDENGAEIDDVQRNREGFAIIGDPRNDENTIISQMQLAFVRFHNRVVDALVEDQDEEQTEAGLLERAQELVRRHYQWVVVNQFLPRICEQSVLEDVLENGREFFRPATPEHVYIPVEFAGAAYRYGHSQIRDKYMVNDRTSEKRFYGPPDEALGFGFQPVAEENTVQWKYFFEIDEGEHVQQSRKIDPLISPVLLELPFIDDNEETSLASRNLLRGRTLKLPSGQAVAREIGVEPLTNEEIGLESEIEHIYEQLEYERPESVEAPLWYYVLAEARIKHDGDRLGPVGSRIVAETLIGLIDADPTSYRRQHKWTPELVSPETDTPAGEFRIADILVDGPLHIKSEPQRSIVIQGTGTHVEYSFTATESLEQVDGELEGIHVTTDQNDSVVGTEATGAVVGGADGFRFSGDITELVVSSLDDVTVYVDGEEMFPESTLFESIIIEGTGVYNEYSFTVSGDLEQIDGPLEGMSVTKSDNDSVEGKNAEGSVVGGADGYRFSGEIEEFTLDDPDEATVYVNGKQRDPRAIGSDIRAAFDANPPSPAPNEAVTFDGGASKAPGDAIARYDWKITRGESSEGSVIDSGTNELFSTRLENPGSYQVELTITTENGITAAETQALQITPEPGGPVARMTEPPQPVTLGQPVTFSDQSTDPDGEIVDRVWLVSHRGETIARATGQTFLFRFKKPGNYTVRLQVNDDDGRQATTATKLTVTPKRAKIK